MLQANALFGRYEIERLLGEGGMGAVYAALDTVLRRRVALKVLEGGAKATAGARARFLREARAAAKLAHPNVVAVFDVGEVDGTPFIAMELVDGRRLRDVLSGGPRPAWRDELRFMLDVARGLAAAHEAGVVHRDVKPENIMITRSGTARVLDFGVAKMLDGEAPASFRTAAGQVVGTPRYMSPEQLAGGAVDARSDQFGWGLVACELLAGRVPLDAPRAASAALAAAAIPDGIAAVIARALSSEPPRRFDSMSDVVSALSPLVEAAGDERPTAIDPRAREGDQPTTTDPRLHVAFQDTHASPPDARPRAARARAPWFVLGALAAAAALASAAVYVRRAPEPAPTRTATGADASADGGTEALHDRPSPSVATSVSTDAPAASAAPSVHPSAKAPARSASPPSAPTRGACRCVGPGGTGSLCNPRAPARPVCWCHVNGDEGCPTELVGGKCPVSVYVPWTTQKRGDACTAHQLLVGADRVERGAWHCRPCDFSPTYDGRSGQTCDGTDANGTVTTGALSCPDLAR